MKTVSVSVFYEGNVKVGHSMGKCLTLTGISKLLARPTLKGGRREKNIWFKWNWLQEGPKMWKMTEAEKAAFEEDL